MNASELARNKFNALFAAHDAKDLRTAAEKQQFALKMVKKEAKKNVKRNEPRPKERFLSHDIGK